MRSKAWLAAHAEVTKNINIFSMGPKLRYPTVPSTSVCVCVCVGGGGRPFRPRGRDFSGYTKNIGGHRRLSNQTPACLNFEALSYR